MMINIIIRKRPSDATDDNKREKKKPKTKCDSDPTELALKCAFAKTYQKSTMPWLPIEAVLPMLAVFDDEECRLAEYLRFMAVLSACNRHAREVYQQFISDDKIANLLSRIYKKKYYRYINQWQHREQTKLPCLFRIAALNNHLYQIVNKLFQIDNPGGKFYQNLYTQTPTHIGYNALGSAFQFDELRAFLTRTRWIDDYDDCLLMRIMILIRDIRYFYNSRYFYRLSLSKKLDHYSVIVLKNQQAKTDYINTRFFGDDSKLMPRRIVPIYTKEGLYISRITTYQNKTKNKKGEECYNTSKICGIKRTSPDHKAIDVKLIQTDDIMEIIKQHEENIRRWEILMDRWYSIKKDLDL